MAAAFADTTSIVVRIDRSGRFVVADDRLSGWPREAAEDLSYDPQRHWLLGELDGVVYFACQGDVDEGVTLREVGRQLRAGHRELATTAVALAAWHHHEPCCPRCGRATHVRSAGFARHCVTCERDLFPRTDPAVIVAVTDGDGRLLLARQGAWPAGRMSLLAGFVEAGEALEHAVHRELAEEVGVTVTDLRYLGSQPWPFPRSLMVAFSARAIDAEVRVDGEEIHEARWFSREDFHAAIADGSLSLPGGASIARRVIEAWVAGSEGWA